MTISSSNLRAILGVVFFLVWIALFSYRFVSTEAKSGRAFLERIPADEVVSISLEPTKEYSLVSRTIVIRDKKHIQSVLEALSGMTRFLPEHPRTTWSVIFRIATRQKQYGGEISGTANQGVIFDYYSDISSGRLYERYQLRSSPTDVSLTLKSASTTP